MTDTGEERSPRATADEVRRALHAAVEAGEHDALARLVREHPGFVDAPDAAGASPLMRAVERGDARSAELLLTAGAAATTHSPAGSALEVATGRSDAALVELLLDHGAHDLRVAFRIAKERRSRAIMEMIAHREPTLQLQMEFDSAIPDQKQIATEALTRRLPDPVLQLDGAAVHLSWTGARNTYLETLPGKPDRTFSVEVQQTLELWLGDASLGKLDGMWYSAVMSGPATAPSKLTEHRWKVRYAYYATAGAYQHYSAVDVTLDLAGKTMEVQEVYETDA